MTLNNRTKIVQHNIRQFVILLLYATIMTIIIFTASFEILIENVNKVSVAVFISLLYIAFLMYNYIIDYNYVYFSDEGNKFVFHYTSTRPLNKKRNAIELAKSKFDGYKIVRTFYGNKKELILFVKTKNGVAKYPPLNISALSKTQVVLLTNSLKQITR